MDARPDSQIYSGQGPATITTDIPPTDSTHHARSTPGKKRRISTAGTRGVANLTQEQLDKKRANDREAQRAIRERTKGQIETLERRIQELTSQQPYQDLQHVIRQKEFVEAENDDIKRRLASVLSIIQPMLGGQTLPGRVLCSNKSSLSADVLASRSYTTNLP